MGLINLFRRKPIEKRADGTGYTAQIMAARASYIAGVSGVGELTATAQACVSLWEGGFALADVQGTDVLPRRVMAIMARALALRGEFVGLISDRGILPASDWEVSTADGVPRAYRLSIPDAGGRARALAQIIEAFGRAKELGLSPAEMQAALASVNFGGGDANA